MKKFSVISALIALVAVLCTASFAGTEYVIANENRYVPDRNALVVYRLDTATGTLTQIALLVTGGEGSGDDSLTNLVNIEQAVSSNAECIFAFDLLYSQITSFSKATGYDRVGSYSNSQLEESDAAGSLALAPNGKFLYATYSYTENIGAWAVNPDCSLTFISAYPAGTVDAPSAIKVTPNGAYLVTVGGGAELFAINQGSGALTDIGPILIGTLCKRACFLTGIDFTKDSKIAVFAGNGDGENGNLIPVALTSLITPTGFTNLRAWSLANPAFLGQNNIPFLSAAAYAGSGNLFFSMLGTSGFPGVLTAEFTEHPLKITVTQEFVTGRTFPGFYDSSIAVTGKILVLGQFPNQIAVFSINADGSLTELSTTTVEATHAGMFSLSVFPNTR